MQPLIRRYVQLLLSVEATESFVKKFIAYLTQRGHLSLLPHILKRLERAEGVKPGQVVLAKEGDAEVFAQSIAAALTTLGVDKGAYAVRVDDRAVGGYSVRAKGKLIDRTYRSALVQLYQKITN
jgi:F0F1-type ATP synthase delta subunit